ncbi:MAG: hypothetical protein ACT4TC_17240 [Myxococcaceae bacterium]
MTSPDTDPPYWVLISVLFSSLPLTQDVAMLLHRTAYELYSTDAAAGEVERGLVRGVVKNLRREALLGTIGGPCFEAELETERGHSTVRFLLTRSGLDMMRPRYMN